MWFWDAIWERPDGKQKYVKSADGFSSALSAAVHFGLFEKNKGLNGIPEDSKLIGSRLYLEIDIGDLEI